MSDKETKPAETPADEGRNLDALPEVKEEKAQEETKPEAEPEAKPENESDPAGDDAGDEDKPKKLSGAARAKLREARLLSELQQREREIEELRRSQPAPKAASESEEKAPEEKDYPDWFAWQRALTAHEAGKASREAIAKAFQSRQQSENQTKQVEIARERDLEHLERVEAAREIIADFDQVMEGMKGVNVRPEVIDEIKSSENSAAIAYHLAKNPQKLAAMDRMSARELAREMGRLEASVKLPEAKRQTSAPAPLTPLKGGASGSFDPEAASMDDYVAKRKAGWKG